MSRASTIAISVGSLAAGAIIATSLTGIAMAEDASPSPSTGTSTAPDGREFGSMHEGMGMRGGMGRHGGMHGDRLGQPVHGESVVKKDDGSFVTVRDIRGSVTAVSATSITVKAEDGFTSTFAVDGDTDVRTGLPTRGSGSATGSISDVKVGDIAHVRGTVDGSSATATEVHGMTAEQAKQMESRFPQR